MVRKFVPLFLFIILTFLLTGTGAAGNRTTSSFYLSYHREVENQLHLSDFQLGSAEKVRDDDGHGSHIGWALAEKSNISSFHINIGASHTNYKGTVEDGVNVSFSPQSGSGYEAISESKNILYDIDLQFNNSFLEITYTNWEFFVEMARHHVYLPPTFGIGWIHQVPKGGVKIYESGGTKIAEATYETNLTYYLTAGVTFNVDFLIVSLQLRHIPSPQLKVTECNEVAIGTEACDRFKAATGNRNNSGVLFTGGIVAAGIIF